MENKWSYFFADFKQPKIMEFIFRTGIPTAPGFLSERFFPRSVVRYFIHAPLCVELLPHKFYHSDVGRRGVSIIDEYGDGE